MKNPAILLLSLILAGCVSAPPQAATGVEVLKSAPARPYRVIDTVQRLGADSSDTYAQQEDSIAREGAARGADAVIVLNTVMVVSRVDPTTARPIMAPKVDAQLIKYQ